MNQKPFPKVKICSKLFLNIPCSIFVVVHHCKDWFLQFIHVVLYFQVIHDVLILDLDCAFQVSSLFSN